jgi:hypothetical protein
MLNHVEKVFAGRKKAGIRNMFLRKGYRPMRWERLWQRDEGLSGR